MTVLSGICLKVSNKETKVLNSIKSHIPGSS